MKPDQRVDVIDTANSFIIALHITLKDEVLNISKGLKPTDLSDFSFFSIFILGAHRCAERVPVASSESGSAPSFQLSRNSSGPYSKPSQEATLSSFLNPL